MSKGISWAVDKGAQVISMSVGLDFPGMVSMLVEEGWPLDIATSFALETYRENLRLFDRLMALVRAKEAFGPGCIVVAASGNESRRNERPEYEVATSLPAAADGMISTGALSRSPEGYTIAPFSNTRPKLCAPGTGIKSAYLGGGLRTQSGTSMACPHVAGVAALWWEAVRAMPVRADADTVRSRVTAACRTDGLARGMVPDVYGSGLVSAP
jgi:subtilisin family serine protease